METITRKKKRKRKCRHCLEFYIPDPWNRWHQRYCSKPECRKASKAAGQRCWLASAKGQGYFQGEDNIRRVREWRAAHPKYWQRGRTDGRDALQDVLSVEVVATQEVRGRLNSNALQDLLTPQPALLVGLIAKLTGNALQDDIAEASRRLIILGRDILQTPSNKPKGGIGDAAKTHTMSGAPAPCA
jgi:hypothetical protein